MYNWPDSLSLPQKWSKKKSGKALKTADNRMARYLEQCMNKNGIAINKMITSTIRQKHIPNLSEYIFDHMFTNFTHKAAFGSVRVNTLRIYCAKSCPLRSRRRNAKQSAGLPWETQELTWPRNDSVLKLIKVNVLSSIQLENTFRRKICQARLKNQIGKREDYRKIWNIPTMRLTKLRSTQQRLYSGISYVYKK